MPRHYGRAGWNKSAAGTREPGTKGNEHSQIGATEIPDFKLVAAMKKSDVNVPHNDYRVPDHRKAGSIGKSVGFLVGFDPVVLQFLD